MKLKSIYFSGFKSFVEPTTFKITDNLVGIVGPNGCGKSNLIDAVRWVMGELSAKTLRGDNMTDVIFSGSSTRAPVGKATIELLFDNSMGKAPGVYAQYPEISIKRSLTRDGNSQYLLNNVNCRRKDIMEIFLGTGLGPRSYSIIEQGMVSRIVESKPDELRYFVEEAAGISKYKEKRRETENRIKNTRENLSRVNDIIHEIDIQLRRLEKQSIRAKQYKQLQDQTKILSIQSDALKWVDYNSKLKLIDHELTVKETGLEKTLAQQRAVESEIEKMRVELSECQQALEKSQQSFYQTGADIKAIEQQLVHQKQVKISQQQELNRLSQQRETIQKQLSNDQVELDKTESEYKEIEPQVDVLKHEYGKQQNTLNSKTAELETCRHDLQELKSKTQSAISRIQVLNTTKEHLENQKQSYRQRLNEIDEEKESLNENLLQINSNSLQQEAASQDEICSELEHSIDQITQNINNKRQSLKDLDIKIKSQSETAFQTAGKLQSLKELQKSALGQIDDQYNRYIKSEGLDGNQRLANLLHVEKGWEKAVDSILNRKSAAICVDNIENFSRTKPLANFELSFIENVDSRQPNPVDHVNSLLSKINSEIDLNHLLNHVLIADTVSEALSMRDQLTPSQCIVTKDGTQIGRNWMSVLCMKDVQSGMVEREQMIVKLNQQSNAMKSAIVADEKRRDSIRNELAQLDVNRREAMSKLSEVNLVRTQLHNKLGHQQENIRQINEKQQRLNNEKISINDEINLIISRVSQDQEQGTQLSQKVERFQDDEFQFESKKEQLTKEIYDFKDSTEVKRNAWHNANLRKEKLATILKSAKVACQRSTHQLNIIDNRINELNQLIKQPQHDSSADGEKLSLLQKDHQILENELAKNRKLVSQLQMNSSELDFKRQEYEKQGLVIREETQSIRLRRQDLATRTQTITERLALASENVDEVIRNLPEQANLEECLDQLQNLEQKLRKLGTVNLLAIEENEKTLERRKYLDAQQSDLNEALATLESVMNKIDKETRTRFRQSFEELNNGFKMYFPKLFGGGSASLELTEDNLLTTGVSVMARPPGKRNTTIHLLSGGEKALTAVSLLFALFKLNPSPLCILDEVDAPLDDANVERYCRLLKQISEHTQLMFITHNKITMEYANLLVGVTMQEPGVSRLVSVDVDKAIEMAQQA